jgi:hypothetical protein
VPNRTTKTVWILAKPSDPHSPDFFNKVTHATDCFIVGSHQRGSWEFSNPRKTWLEVPVVDVLPGTRRCSFCGGGR